MTLERGKWKWGWAIVPVALLSGCPGPGPSDGGSGGSTAGGSTAGGSAAGGAGGSGGGAALVDLDVVVARFEADGGVDRTFGDGGLVRLDLGTATSTANRDLVWSIARDGTDNIVVFAAAKGTGARTDSDRIVLRLTANGAVDTTFATQGQYRLDMNGLSDNARHGVVQTDGKIVGGGYVTIPNGLTADGGTATTNVPAILRLDSDGVPDPTFGDGGVASVMPAAFVPADGGALGMVEVYSAAPTATGQYVTTGYGHLGPSGNVDLISVRLNANGTLDTSWSSNAGYYLFDGIGDHDRGRNMAVLPDGRVVMTGSTAVASPNVLDALVVMLTAGGQLDATFNAGMGFKTYNFTGADEAWWGAALSPNGMQLAAVGYSAGGSNANDDSTLLLLPVMAGAPAELSGKVPLSATAHDRLLAAAWDPNGRVVAAGMVNVAGDTAFAVARFTSAGALDTTFGGQGFVTLNASAGGTLELARAIVVQSTGKIVIAGIAEH